MWTTDCGNNKKKDKQKRGGVEKSEWKMWKGECSGVQGLAELPHGILIQPGPQLWPHVVKTNKLKFKKKTEMVCYHVSDLVHLTHGADAGGGFDLVLLQWLP